MTFFILPCILIFLFLMAVVFKNRIITNVQNPVKQIRKQQTSSEFLSRSVSLITPAFISVPPDLKNEPFLDQNKVENTILTSESKQMKGAEIADKQEVSDRWLLDELNKLQAQADHFLSQPQARIEMITMDSDSQPATAEQQFEKNVSQHTHAPDHDEKPERKGISGDELRNMKLALLRSLPKVEMDDLIDVTDQPYELNTSFTSENEIISVPDWPHQYVYSLKAIQTANEEQLKFYNLFKSCFIENNYLDIRGNSNYAFILLFDLIGQYNTHMNLDTLSRHLTALGKNYPKTESYADTFFQRIKNRESGNQIFVHPRPIETFYQRTPEQAQEYWKLGSKYKSKLGLNHEQENLLNQLWNQSNSFCNIEYCYLEVIKLYLLTHSMLNQLFAAEAVTLSQQLDLVADLVARKQHRFRKGSLNYNNCIESTRPQLSVYVFKMCENLVREAFAHKRKLGLEITFTTAPEAIKTFRTLIVSKFESIAPELIKTIQSPDEKTNIELNGLNPTRWKIEFECLKSTYTADAEKLVEAMLVLGHRNRKNPMVENIFYEGFKFLASRKRKPALHLYIYYVNHGLKLAGFENKQLPKTVQRLLFDSEMQFQQFEGIIGVLKKDRDVAKAIQSVPGIYTIKRKTIQLDVSSIKEVLNKHSGTVRLLETVLNTEQDEIPLLPVMAVEPQTQNVPSVLILPASGFRGTLNFNAIQQEVLTLFSENDLSFGQKDLEAYCIERGLFKNQLVDSINDSCYDLLDDVLIEQDEDFYTIDPHHYQRILTL